MRISHTQLEECRTNPRAWFVGTYNAPAHGYKMGYERVLRLAIFYFHKSLSKSAARKHMDELIADHHFQDLRRIAAIESDLESYFRWFEGENVKTADTQVRIQLVHGFLEMRGELSRVDYTPGGYRSVLFGDAPPFWEKQLRMPLIQIAVSELFGRPVDEVQVGFQRANGTRLLVKTFSPRELSSAKATFQQLGEQLRSIASPGQ